MELVQSCAKLSTIGGASRKESEGEIECLRMQRCIAAPGWDCGEEGRCSSVVATFEAEDGYRVRRHWRPAGHENPFCRR